MGAFVEMRFESWRNFAESFQLQVRRNQAKSSINKW